VGFGRLGRRGLARLRFGRRFLLSGGGLGPGRRASLSDHLFRGLGFRGSLGLLRRRACGFRGGSRLGGCGFSHGGLLRRTLGLGLCGLGSQLAAPGRSLRRSAMRCRAGGTSFCTLDDWIAHAKHSLFTDRFLFMEAADLQQLNIRGGINQRISRICGES